MSISKHITHHLTGEGRAFFPAWFERLCQAARATSGFNRVLHGTERNDAEATHVILQFENREGLLNWQHNDEHYALLSSLSPYLKQPSDIRFFEFEDNVDTAA